MSTHAHRVHGLERRPVVHVPGSLSVRLAALGGAIFFALFIAFASLTSGTPSITDSGQDTYNNLLAHDSRLQLAAVLFGLAMPAGLLALSGVFRALREAEGGRPGLAIAALGGGVLAAASTVTGALIMGVTATRITEIGPANAHLWWTMCLTSYGAILLGLLLLIGATGVVSLETGLFPRWFGVASLVLALVSIVGAFSIGYATTGVLAAAGIALVLDSAWILVVSYFLWRDPELALPREAVEADTFRATESA